MSMPPPRSLLPARTTCPVRLGRGATSGDRGDTELETVWAWVRNGQGQRTGCEVVQELVGQQKRSGQEALCSV